MVYPVLDGAVTIGRSASSTIQIVDKRVSRHHAVLRRARGTYVAEDLGSKNGTYVNDEPLVGRVNLNLGDRLHIGDSILLFERDPDEVIDGEASDTRRSGNVKLVADEPGMSSNRAEKRVDAGSGMAGVRGENVTREILRDPLMRLRVLYEVADSLRGEMETGDLLRKIMDILWNVVTPYRGIVLLRDPSDGTLEPVVARTRDGSTSEISISKGVVEQCVRDQVAILISDAPSDVRFAENDSIVAGRIRSAICTPMVHKGEVLGVLYIDSQDPGSIYYTNDDLDLMTGIANQAAMAISNIRLQRQSIERQRLEKELEIARSIQMNLLPKEYPRIPGVQFAAMSQPARQVGGDYYDFVTMEDGRVAMVVADVSGKGVPAAMVTATIRASLRLESSQTGKHVHEIVGAINKWTCVDASNNMFVTMIYAIYDPASRRLSYTNAGHCFPMLFKPDGRYRTFESGGCFLGIMEFIDYESEELDIEPGDTLLLYTDGVTDAHNLDKEIMGNDRLIETIRQNLSGTAEELRDEIYEATLVFRGQHDQFDDMTILVVKF